MSTPGGIPDRYCPRCAEALRPGAAPAGQPGCPACGFVLYANPKVATGVVAERDGQILLVRRDHEPKMGEWSFPSGFVDAGEVVEEAAMREAREETGLRVRPQRLLGVFSAPGDPVVFIAYAATVEAGEPEPLDEVQDVAFFPADRLPPLAFPHDPAIIAAWRTGAGIAVGEAARDGGRIDGERTDSPPTDRPPADRPPAGRPPADSPPADRPPADRERAR